jgi:hypothetical protein
VIDRTELERLADDLRTMTLEDLRNGKVERVECELRALAARCDNNPAEEKEVMQFDPAERKAIVHQPVAKPPVSEAGGDQPAGEPVPLPEPAYVRTYYDWPDEHYYTADQLRTYAGAVAFARGMSVAEQYDRDLRKMLERAETAEREREADRRDAERYRWLRAAHGSDMHGMWHVRGYENCVIGQQPEELDAAIDAAMGDSNTTGADVSDTTAHLIRMLRERDALGRAKYGTTLDRTDLTHEQWLQHMVEEMLDGAGYALAAIRAMGEGNAD